MPAAQPEPVDRLSRRALTWRAAALAGGVLLIAHGTFFGNDVQWPFAPMSQFAFRVGHNGAIHSTFLQARTQDGAIVPISLSPGSVGIARAEVEGQLPAIERNPQLLGDLAQAYHRLHPHTPPMQEFYLRDRVTLLRDGRVSGQRVDTLVTWTT